ncbi:hypothetical protein LU196_11665 [Pantoea sp. Mb-10]|uniref:hypothetical protein n=1 Tax=unclassified Pantoea TaxID=2630326 RepID=UPI001E2FFA73|nr:MULTISPECIES: hypothetical protein [unclassified Pantoea]MCE0490704.1 hypothetical protein [Pantoea sp. Mb-10]MCE0500138.1 hypothetical protein [Pantoea sp. Pb-8]
MGTAIFMVLMVCGYWYTNRDMSSRLKIKRSFGWDVYFLIALYGCIFVVQGVLATAFIWLVLLAASALNNALALSEAMHARWHVDFMTWSFLGIQAPVVVMLTFAVLFCVYRSNWAGSARLTASRRKDLYQRLSRSNGIEQLLLQCMEEGELAWVTLKSRRIYIGMIHAATFEYANTANIVIIPMLSGYRDARTLNLAIEHNYSRWYDQHSINFVSEPKSALDFRKVIMVSQIESLSLFDPASASALALDQPQRKIIRSSPLGCHDEA